MEAIHVLSHEPEMVHASFQFNQGKMGRIRFFGREQFAAPIVPFPDESGIASKRFGRGQFFRAKVLPQPLSPTKRRHAAVRGNPGAGQHRDGRSRGKLRPQFLNGGRSHVNPTHFQPRKARGTLRLSPGHLTQGTQRPTTTVILRSEATKNPESPVRVSSRQSFEIFRFAQNDNF